jgi:putative DNA primase/helicase
MSTNFPPVFSAGDDALWNRAKTVPFRFSFKTYEKADKTAKDRLKEPKHRAGILAWALNGCRAWQADGLRPPAAVQDETTTHRHDVDVIHAFVDERCEIDADATPVSSQALHRAYKVWSREQSAPQLMTLVEFRGEMQRAGYAVATPLVNRNRHERWQNLRLKGADE